MKKMLALLAALLLGLTLTGCGGADAPALTNAGSFEGFTLELGNAEVVTAPDGQQALRVHATYTNESGEAAYALSCFVVRAFQNGQELASLSDINGDEAALIQEARSGVSLDVAYLFALPDVSPVEVTIGEPTAEEAVVGRASYLGFDENQP